MTKSPEFKCIEACAFHMKRLMEARCPDFSLNITCASSKPTEYESFIAITQRIQVKDEIIGYLTYRTKRPKKSQDIEFSSYEELDPLYRRISKFHVDETDAKKTFIEVFNHIVELCDKH